LLFAAFLGLSRVTLNEARKKNQQLNFYYSLKQEFINIQIGSQVYRDNENDAEFVGQFLQSARKLIEQNFMAFEEVERGILIAMIETLDSYASDFEKMVKSNAFLSNLDGEVHKELVNFGDLKSEMQDDLISRLRAAPSPEERVWLEDMIFSNGRLWGWLNRAISVFDRDLMLEDNLGSFNANFVRAIQASENDINSIKENGALLAVEGLEDYVFRIGSIMIGLKAISVEYTVAARADAELAVLLEDHGNRLRAMIDRLIERSQAESREKSEQLSTIFWSTAVATLLFAGIISTWFSISVSRPIRRLRENFKVVAEGNFNLHVIAPGKGELDDLARAFNDMTDKLKRSYAEVEDKVKQRTNELQLATVRSKQLADAAQEANLAKSAFLATMSHEIRTPLNSIIGFSELLESTPLNEEQLEDLAMIRRSGNILLELINNILDLSKIEAGKMSIDSQPIDVGDLIYESCALFRIQAQRKGLELNVEVSPELPEAIFSDPTRLQQVLSNLISNAIKFTDSGGITVRGGLKKEKEGSDELVFISISDTGIGIAEDKLNDVFMPFTQADSSTTRKYGGTGLGLAICKRIAEVLGGAICVESVVGKGSTFSFTFRDLSELHKGDAEAIEGETPTALQVDAGLSILVAEDDPTNFKLISKLLGRFGLSPDWAKNGRQAVEMYHGGDYDLVLMDLQMPELDGYSAAREIAAIARGGRPPYIVALTANVLSESREACREAGMRDFLAKPISGEELKAFLVRFRSESGEGLVPI